MTEPRAVPADEAGIAAVVEVVRSGGLAVCPTMTNYVVVCDAMNADAVRRVFSVKRRVKLGPLPVSVSGVDEFAEVVDVPSYLDLDKLRQVWPTELGLIARQRAPFPPELTCGLGTVSCTQSRHPVASAVQRAFGGPLAGSSANLSGTTVRVVTLAIAKEHLGSLVDVYLDAGPTPGESSDAAMVADTIVDLTFDRPTLCRAGAYPLEAVRELFPDLDTDVDTYRAAIARRAEATSAPRGQPDRAQDHVARRSLAP
jgi:L-threonylcarbamoyladenylate synthase